MGYIGSQPATNFETVRKQVSTTNSGTTITLDYSVSSVQDILVTVNAVVQSYDNYSVSGTTLTLGGTLNNDRVEILYVGRTFQTVTPAVGTVTNEMLSGSIANSKLANSSITLNGSSVSLGGSATVGGDNTPSFMATMSANQTVSENTFHKIQFNTEVLDTDNAYDTSNYRFTPQTSGNYLITLSNSIEKQGAGSNMMYAYSRIYKNGSSVFSSYSDYSANYGYAMQGTVSAIINLNGSSDYVEAYAYANNNDNANIVILGSVFSNFYGVKIIT